MSRLRSDNRWTVSEAARALRVSEKTVYRRIKSGQLNARLKGQSPGAHWLIEPVDTGGHIARQEYTCREDTVSLTAATVELLRGQLGEKDRQIAELHVLLRDAQGQLKGLLLAPQGEGQSWGRDKNRRRWWWPF